ncbi:MAG TPA: hypothetical protein VEU47_02905 [Candidatus Cybelea sp.]|nr:hypothetical protein [Candidatus Cybelea sp.]
MLIGIDFDNTIAGYDRLFARLAVDLGLLPNAPEGGKKAVRDAVRSRHPEGDLAWQRLQAIAYGERMQEAELIAGVGAFLTACRERRIPVRIVSHKTRHAACDPWRVDLRSAALAWMRQQGFFDRFGLAPEHVFFESSRHDKVARIRNLRCTHFIDDLEEVFAEPGFPAEVEAILFDPAKSATSSRAATLAHWHDIEEHVLGSRH